MKRVITLLASLSMVAIIFSQSPEKMSYQAVIRNSNGTLVSNSNVGIRIQILQTSETGAAVYVETHTSKTNENGLVTIELGGGTPVTGTFADIDWSAGPYFLTTETDPTGGTDYTIVGTSQILSVPYALHAKTAENITSTITETDPTYTSSQAANITETDITKLSNLSGVNTGDQDLSAYATKNMENDNITDLANPVNEQDAATKAYVDDALISILSNYGIIVADADSNIYSTVRIGSQIWMAENLKTTKYNDGTPIPNVSDATEWEALTTGAYADYDNTPGNSDVYGKLYNYYAMVDARKLCPAGWHIPTTAEFTTLIILVGFGTVGGYKLKEIGTIHWNSPNTGATNETGFTALPGGYRNYNGSFENIREKGYWWSTKLESQYGWYISLDKSGQISEHYNIQKGFGLSARCLKD